MAGGTLYIEPILADLQEKVSDLEIAMGEVKLAVGNIPAKIDEQIDEMQGIVSLLSNSANCAIAPGDEKEVIVKTTAMDVNGTNNICNIVCYGDGSITLKLQARMYSTDINMAISLVDNTAGVTKEITSSVFNSTLFRDWEINIPLNYGHAYAINAVKKGGGNGQINSGALIKWKLVNVVEKKGIEVL